MESNILQEIEAEVHKAFESQELEYDVPDLALFIRTYKSLDVDYPDRQPLCRFLDLLVRATIEHPRDETYQLSRDFIDALVGYGYVLGAAKASGM